MVVTNSPTNTLTTLEHSYSSTQLSIKANRDEEEIANETSDSYVTDTLISESTTNTTVNTNEDVTSDKLDSVRFFLFCFFFVLYRCLRGKK